MKVLISAEACAPHRGSEPGAGWAWTEAAAFHHDVWLLTPARNRAAIEAELDSRPDLARLNPVFVDDQFGLRHGQSGLRLQRLRNALWQRRVAKTARALHGSVGFDVAHHVTFASDWQPCGLVGIEDLPLVWGPVGGATRTARPVWPLLGVRGVANELARSAITGTLRRVVGRPIARRAALTVATNDDAAASLPWARLTRTEPNVAVDPVVLDQPDEPPARATTPGRRRAVFVGRLIPWKGASFAMRALQAPEAADWELQLFGNGPEEARLRHLAERLGVADRVLIEGYRPRAEVLAALRHADVFVFPSLHDSSGWALAEAITLGCPVICLDRGGPAVIARAVGGTVVPVTRRVVADIAAALAAVGPRSGMSRRWTSDRLPAVVDELYESARASVPVG